MKIGFIGLGQMGRSMANRLLDRGYPLSVWNRSAAAAETFRQRGATVTTRPEQLFDCDVVITMLADDAAVEAVWMMTAPSAPIRTACSNLYVQRP